MDKTVLLIIGAWWNGHSHSTTSLSRTSYYPGRFSEPATQKSFRTASVREPRGSRSHLRRQTTHQSKLSPKTQPKPAVWKRSSAQRESSPLGIPPKTIYETNLLRTANVIEAFADIVISGSSMVCIASITAHSCPPLSTDCLQHLARTPCERLLDQPQG